LICVFIDEHREEFGVGPICRALAVHGVQIAPRTYWAHRSSGPSKRALWDTTITEILAGVYEPDERGKRPPECLYGSLKIWAHLRRQGIPVARCTVERIMRTHGWRGAVRARTVRTTERDPAAARARRTWCGGASTHRDPTSWTWPTSPTCRSMAAGSATPRS
jgi:putative transposase